MQVRNSVVAAGAAVCILLGAYGCASIVGPDGVTQSVVVSCDTSTPAKAVACTAATLQSVSATTSKQLVAGRLTPAQSQLISAKLENAYSLLLRAEQAAAIGDSSYSDPLGLAEDILTAIELELKK